MYKFFIQFISLFSIIVPSTTFITSYPIIHNINNNNNNNNQLQTNKLQTNKLQTNKLQTNIIMLDTYCPDYLTKYSDLFNEKQSEFIVKKIAGIFPKMDVISHYVLHTNDVLINTILNDNHLKIEIKKILVLSLINLTQSGDATGGHILQLYQDIVNCLL
jgi:hypothetical protein